MAQHLPIQAKHHCQFKNNTPSKRTTAFPPGPAHLPPGETVPDRLAVFTSRQAPAFSQTPLFSRHRLAEHTVPPSACLVQTLSR